MKTLTRPALRYHGGKWRLASWIISYFPPHVCYVEPFGGAMSVLLRKLSSPLEVYNDLDEEVITFFRVLRERPYELEQAISNTPFSRRELDVAFDAAGDDLERARRLYIRAWQGRGGPRAMWRTGWRFQKTMARHKTAISDWTDIAHLQAIARRLKQVQIECDDALTVIKRFDTPDTLFYLDPPYLPSTRSSRWGKHAYTYEMSEDDHCALAELLHSIEGMALISSYPSEMYVELYTDWISVSKQTKTDANTSAMEILWISPNAMMSKLPLFADNTVVKWRVAAAPDG